MSENSRTSAIVSAPSAAPDSRMDAVSTIPELSESWFDQASLYIGEVLVRRGRPKTPAPKVAINIRLSHDVLSRFKATGRGWQTRINQALEQWLETHPEVG